MFAEGIAYEGRAISLRSACGLVGSMQQPLVEDNLNDFHVHSIFHIRFHNQLALPF